MPSDHDNASPEHQAPIPENLRKQLEDFKKRLWQIKIAEAVLAGFFGLLFSFLLVFALDRFVETPTSVRLVILIGGVSLFTIFAPYWIHRWVYGHRRENQLARLIARRFPRLGDRLLGAVELQDQTETKESLSPELRAAAMRTVAEDAAGRDLSNALPAARHRKWSLVVIALFTVSVISLVSMPEAGINALKRWLMPLAETERFTFTQLDLSGLGTPHHVPYGESFTITIPLHQETQRRPETARARYGNTEWVEAKLIDNAYTFEFPGQRAKDTVRFVADDASHDVVFEPMVRPAIENVRASVKLPDYLEREDIDADLRSGFMTVLEGSEVRIHAAASRELRSAIAEAHSLPNEDTKPELIPGATPLDQESDQESSDTAPSAVSGTPEPRGIKLKIDGRKITTSPTLISNHSLMIPISWVGIFGLKSDTPLKLRIETTKDQTPTTYIQGIDRQHTMLAEETLNFEVLAEDDYGLKSCGISWQGEFTKPTGQSPASGEITIDQGSSTRTTFNVPWRFCPENHGVEPQKLILRSWAEDYLPGRGKVYSEPIILYILTRDEHAQVLKNEFDRTIGELEDIARKEQNLNDENKRLQRKSGEELQKEENRKKLEAQQEAERQNKERMQEQTEKMEKLFKDAVRNGEIDKQTLQKMGKALQQMKELSKEDLPKVEQKLQESQSQKNTPEKAKKDLDEAIEQQDKAIKKMKQAIKDANEANRNFEASTFVNRLKRAANEEDGIASAFIGMINKVIGATPSELDPVEARALKAAAAQQSQTAADVRWIQEDLAHYYARTQKDEHKKLVDEMRSSRIDEAMEYLAAGVANNLSWKSTLQAKQWAAQLRAWAKKLEGDNNQGGGGGGDGGGQTQEDKDFEFMLKVMRMIQKEQDIRERTRALEDFRRTFKKAATIPEHAAP